MSRFPKWTGEELIMLGNMIDEGKDYSFMSKELHRGIVGIKLIIRRKLNRSLKRKQCLDCGESLESRNPMAIRCHECSESRTKKMKKDDSIRRAEFYQNMKMEHRFGGNRQKALERDRYTCQVCGKTHHEIMLDVHHKDKSGRNKLVHNHDIDNLITICHSCHTKQHKEDTIMKRWAKK